MKKSCRPRSRALWLGGRGLGAYLALRERLYDVEPLAPENPLIFAPGPLTGTGAPASGRYSVTSRSPLTGTVFDGNSGGNFGNALRRLGWDYLVVDRRAGRARLRHHRAGRRRRGFAGRPSRAVRRPRRRGAASRRRPVGPRGPGAARARARAAPESEAAVIGPAGERGVLFASIVNNRGRSIGRGGLGTVMGAKRLKALVVERPRRAQAAGRRPGAPRVHRLRGREAAQVQPDHLHGAARVRHLRAGQRAQPGRRPAHAQPPREPVRGRRRHLRRDAASKDHVQRRSACRGCIIGCARRTSAGGADRRRPRVRDHLGARAPSAA